MINDFEIVFYRSDSGECPVLDFISGLDKKLKAKVFRDLQLLEHNGNNLGMPFSKYLEDGIFELRTKLGSDITRIFYFFVIHKQIVVTNGFKKKTVRTPYNEIQKAKKYKNDFLDKLQKGGYYDA